MANSSLKELRNKVRQNCEVLNKQKELAIRKLEIVLGFGNTENVMISFEDLSLFKIGERIEVNNSVTFEKTYQDENKLVFLTFMLEGGSFGIHTHDCFEFCKILKGNLFEKNRGLKVYSEGDIVIYAPNETHTPYATMNSTYEVTFYKNII